MFIFLKMTKEGREGMGWSKNGHLRPHGSLYVICIAKLLAVAVQ
jgi:hypothetical protein